MPVGRIAVATTGVVILGMSALFLLRRPLLRMASTIAHAAQEGALTPSDLGQRLREDFEDLRAERVGLSFWSTTSQS